MQRIYVAILHSQTLLLYLVPNDYNLCDGVREFATKNTASSGKLTSSTLIGLKSIYKAFPF